MMFALAGVLQCLMPAGLAAQDAPHADIPAKRGPRFFMLGEGRSLPIDIERSPTLMRRISLALHNAPVEDALTQIAASAQLRFFYSKDALSFTRRVNLESSSITVADALTAVLLGSSVDVLFSSTTQAALIRRDDVDEPPAAGTVAGHVTATDASPIVGATVTIDGTQLQGITSDSGAFRIPRVPPGPHTLLVRRLGFVSKSAAVDVATGTAASTDFVLNATPRTLEDVIVTGAGTQTTREKLAISLNTVTAAAIRRQSSPQNVAGALYDVPGVEVRTQSGEPGASVSVLIRGVTTLSGSAQPLFVVDGVPIDNSTLGVTNGNVAAPNRVSDIDPNDIESVQVLKGAAAGAIYGARASNGVILITTNRAKPGPTHWSFNTSASADKIDVRLALQHVYGQGSNSIADSPTCGITDASCSAGSFGPPLPPGTTTYDHLHELFRTGATYDNSLQLSGGDDRTTFLISGGETRQQGTVIGPNNTYTRTAMRGSGQVELRPDLRIGASLNYFDARGRYLERGDNPDGLLLGAFRSPPEFNQFPYLSSLGVQRSYRFPRPAAGTDTLSRGYDNPVWLVNVPLATSELGRSLASVNAEWTPFDWITLKETLGADYYDDSRLEALPLSSSGSPTGRVTQNNFNNLEIDHNLIAAVTKAFTPKLTSTLTVGHNLNSRRSRTISVIGSRLIAPQPFEPQNTTQVATSFTQGLAHVQAGFAQEQLDVYQQVFVTLGLRDDGFSTFGAAKRTAWYPRASAAWDVTRFFGHAAHEGLLDYAKLRVAYGETGKEPPLYAAVSGLTTSTQFISSIGNDGLGLIQSGNGGLTSSRQLGNPNLRPERQIENEVGADVEFLDQRVEAGLTRYDKRAYDIVLPLAVNTWSTGAYTQFQNAASISNQGIEIALRLHPIRTDRVQWDLGVNYSKSTGQVLSLAGASVISLTSDLTTGAAIVGYAPGVFYGGDFIKCGRGVRANVGLGGVSDIDALCAQSPGGLKPGALFLAANGQPMADPTPRVLGDPNPKHLLSYNSSLHLGGRLTLSTLVDARHGGQVYDGTRAGINRFGTSQESADARLAGSGTFGKNFYADVFPDVAGPGAGVVAFSTPAQWQAWFTGLGQTSSTLYVEDGSFVRWRELTLSYTADNPLAKLTGFSKVDVGVAARNLKLWTKYKGIDPEGNLFGAASLTQGMDTFNFPQTRSFVVSLHFTQ